MLPNLEGAYQIIRDKSSFLADLSEAYEVYEAGKDEVAELNMPVFANFGKHCVGIMPDKMHPPFDTDEVLAFMIGAELLRLHYFHHFELGGGYSSPVAFNLASDYMISQEMEREGFDPEVIPDLAYRSYGCVCDEFHDAYMYFYGVIREQTGGYIDTENGEIVFELEHA